MNPNFKSQNRGPCPSLKFSGSSRFFVFLGFLHTFFQKKRIFTLYFWSVNCVFLNAQTNEHIVTSRAIFIKRISVGALIFVSFACSRKEDRWLNRNYHALTSYYNTIYHGNLALENGKTRIAESYQDDYWHLLPIEPLFNDKEKIIYGRMIPQPGQDPQPEPPQTEDYADPEEELVPQQRIQLIRKEREKQLNENFQLQNENQRQALSNPSGREEFFSLSNTPSQLRNTQQLTAAQRTFNNTPQHSAPAAYPQDQQYPLAANGYPSNTTTYNTNYSSTPSNQRYGGPGMGMGSQPFISSPLQRGTRQHTPRQIGPIHEPNSADAFAATLATYQENTSFEIAEEKAVKAIQKHSMLFKGVERNQRIKEAFLLLGKTRYYQQRYFPALEAFNYILNRYEDQNFLTTADIWIEKTYLRLGNNEERVIQRLSYLLNNSDYSTEEAVKDTITPFKLNKANLREAASTLAQAYINTKQNQQALAALDLALTGAEDKEHKGRYHYIKGQLLEKMERPEQALEQYQHMVSLNRKIPREYWIHAYMKALRLARENSGEAEQKTQLADLKKRLKDWELKPYRSLINYELAEVYRALDSMPAALPYYVQALQTNPGDHQLSYAIYQNLADYYFDHQDFPLAAAYYDSTMVNVPASSRTYRALKKRRLSLMDINHFEEIAHKNDSILRLAEMDPFHREAYLSAHLDSLKKQALEAVKNPKKTKNKKGNRAVSFSLPSFSGSASFYFYNPTQVQQGQLTFQKIWGNRALQDNWRMKNTRSAAEKRRANTPTEPTKAEVIAQIENDPKYQVETYLQYLPNDPEELNHLAEERSFAYYQLGLIYDERLHEDELAANRFERLLAVSTNPELIKPSAYRLYKLHQRLGHSDKAAFYRSLILKDYPDSRYAQVLNDPNAYTSDAGNPEKVYEELYKAYQSGQYRETLEALEKETRAFADDPILAKMELLKAIITGRVYGISAYEKELQHVAMTYPHRIEGEKAREILEQSLPQIKDETFVADPWVQQKLIYRIPEEDPQTAIALQKQLDTYIEKEHFEWLHTSIDQYAPGDTFVIIHGLRSVLGLTEFRDLLNKKLDDQLPYDHFEISSLNYEKILIHKSLAQYLDWLKEQNK